MTRYHRPTAYAHIGLVLGLMGAPGFTYYAPDDHYALPIWRRTDPGAK